MKIKVGTILELKSNNYRITEKIAEGGNSSVWKAKVDGEPRVYAIKILNYKIGSDKLDRFKRECQFCKDTDNKHIIKIFDYIAEEDKAYCVMPYYSRNLRSVIDEENDSFVLFDHIIQLCEALSFIHNHNDSIIHRDLKPENILVDDKNTLVLTDFGIAHFDDSTKTKRRDWLGNRRYAAPEQLATDDITTACDIYALGRIINEIFTKQNPSGEDFLTIADVNPLLFTLDSIVQKCRIQNPDLRPNINEILTELYLLEGEIKDIAEFIKMSNYPIANTNYTEDEKDQIISLATHDIILAQYIFENLSDEKLEKLNRNYHWNILYDVDAPIQNLLFQTTVLDYCSRKFKYESNSYINGGYNTIGEMFSRPYNGDTYKYLPTQYIAEEIKNMGFDGLRFKSSLNKNGYNVVLFNPDDCVAVSSDLVEVKAIELKLDDPLIYKVGTPKLKEEMTDLDLKE